MAFNRNVGYLEDTDFHQAEDGQYRLNVNSGGRPVVVKMFSSQCGHCVEFHPEFQKFADENEGSVFSAVVQADGERESERRLTKQLIDTIPNFEGFPSVYLYVNGVNKGEYPGSRNAHDLLEWVKQNV